MKQNVLEQIKNREITPAEGYNLLYLPEQQSGRFLAFRIYIKESKVVSSIINFFFFIPMPIGIAKIILQIVMKKKNIGIERKDLKLLFNSCRHFRLSIDNDDVKIRIKIL